MTTVYAGPDGNTPYDFPDSMSADEIQSHMNTLVDPNTGQPYKPTPGNPPIDLLYGMEKPIANTSNLLARGVAAISPAGSGLQSWAQSQEGDPQRLKQAYEDIYAPQKPPQTSIFRDVGEAIPPAAASVALPYSSGAFLPRLASNAVGGAISGLMTSKPDASLSDIAANTGEGAALGAAVAPFTGAVARTAYPAMAQPGSDMRAMMDIGVRPTIGQALGGGINRVEQAATSIPFVGDLIKNARQRSVYQFNTGIARDVLEPIGETLDATQPGREMVAEVANKVSAAYNRAVPTAGGTLDQQARNELADLRARATALGPGREAQFNSMLDQYVTRRIDPATGTMTGQGFKDAESDLGKETASYLKGAGPDERGLGLHLQEAQTTLRNWLERVNPQAAGDLRAANQAYSRQLRLQYAAARPGGEPGVFSPQQYQAAVAHYAPQSQVATGRALGQDVSDAGRAVLGPTVPDSGTPFRNAVRIGAGLALGHGTGIDAAIPLSAKIGTAGATAVAAAPYTPFTQPLVAHLLASRYPWMQNVASGARSASPVIAGAQPAGLLNRDQPY